MDFIVSKANCLCQLKVIWAYLLEIANESLWGGGNWIDGKFYIGNRKLIVYEDAKLGNTATGPANGKPPMNNAL